MKISYDPGHYSVSAFNGEQIRTVLSIVGEPRGDILRANDREEILTADFGHWFIGQTALIQSSNLEYGRSEKWAFTDAYRSLMLYVLSFYFASETDSGVVDLVMGLPIQDYRQNQGALKKLFTRNYKIERSKTGKKNMRDLNLFIRSIKFLPQGLAPARPYLAPGKKIVCLDLGSRNINYITIDITSGKVKVVDKDTRSREAGATVTINSIIGDIADLSGREFSIPQIVDLIQSRQDTIMAGGQEYDVKDILDHHLSSYRGKILSLIQDVWGNAKDIDRFIVFGGGDYLAGEMILREYPHQVTRHDDPLFASVKAQYDYFTGGQYA